MFARHILDPLRWFGLVEYRGPEVSFDVRWRKTALFDRFLSFGPARFRRGRSAGGAFGGIEPRTGSPGQSGRSGRA